MVEFRCKKCNRKLGMEHIIEGELEVRCPRCKTYNTLRSGRTSRVIDTFRPKIYNKDEKINKSL